MVEISDDASPKLLNVSLLIVIALFIIYQTLCISRVSGISMEPTLHDSSIVISLKTSNLEQGDIIIFAGANYGFESNIIKRVIALPGDRVTIERGKVYINGNLQYESYLPIGTQTDGDVKLIVSKNMVFVLGDNRGLSLDSRELGLIQFNDIIGVMEVVL